MAVLFCAAGLVATAPGAARADQGPSFVHWTAAGPSGATGTLSATSVTLTGPMGTAFYLNDNYPNFNSPAFAPQLPATGMVEIVGATGHTNGTIRLNGTFTTITYTAVPNFTGNADGILLQIGGTR